MYPLRELKNLLAVDEALPGIVVSSSIGAVTCATPVGLREARVTGRELKAGEAVVVRAGVAVPRATPSASYIL